DFSKQYNILFRKIYLPYRVIQIVSASTMDNLEQEYKGFLKKFLNSKIVGETPDKGDICDCISSKLIIHIAESLLENLCYTKFLDFFLYSPRPQILKVIKSSKYVLRYSIRAEIEAEIIDSILEECSKYIDKQIVAINCMPYYLCSLKTKCHGNYVKIVLEQLF
ncbi:hypothetical protein P692DRAFT_20727509, partial [Suillus brevipes Sb2]